jgi:hypothetical protein
MSFGSFIRIRPRRQPRYGLHLVEPEKVAPGREAELLDLLDRRRPVEPLGLASGARPPAPPDQPGGRAHRGREILDLG